MLRDWVVSDDEEEGEAEVKEVRKRTLSEWQTSSVILIEVGY